MRIKPFSPSFIFLVPCFCTQVLAIRAAFLTATTSAHVKPSLGVLLHARKDSIESPSSNKAKTILTKYDKRVKAYPQQTPHSGRHFLPSHPAYHRGRIDRIRNIFRWNQRRNNQRFMEGWYYRLTLPPPTNVSFAFIFSIEDPGHVNPPSKLALAAVQVMGPNDEYLVQADPDDTKFWAWEGQQGLGCTFEWNDDTVDNTDEDVKVTRTALEPDEWRRRVKTGFQMLPACLQGRVNGHDGSLGGVRDGQGMPGTCTFDMTIEPLSGWGSDDCERGQRSTAGWLASFAVFEPHWQVTMADGRATGTVTWKDQTYNFVDAPFYAEKNWGGAFPSKWYWAQCNAFEGYTERGKQLSVTAGGGTRKIPFGQKESLGMVCIHYNGTFYEAVPWTGSMEWEVTPWGLWLMKGRCTSGDRLFEAEITAKCDVPGVVLRAPTLEDGLAYFCRDSFYADTTLSLWELEWDEEIGDYVRSDSPPIIDRARSKQGGVEVGGGPWWDVWKGVSKMKQPMRSLVKFPYKFYGVRRNVRKVKSKIKGKE